MMGEKGIELSRYLGGDAMLSILICDDDISVIDTMKKILEEVLREEDKKAKIYTFTDAVSVSDQIDRKSTRLNSSH